MIKVGVKNFQIIEKAYLPLEGIIVLSGASGNGKSCLVRAIEACIYNRTGDDCITLPDLPSTSIRIAFEESKYHPALQIDWTKPRGSGASYVLNGKDEYTKVGQTSLPEIISKGFEELKTTNGGNLRLHFWDQTEFFLIKKTPSTIFEVLSKLLEDRKLLPVLKKMKDHITSQQKESVKLEGQHQMILVEIQNIEKQLLLYEEFRKAQANTIKIGQQSKLLKLLYESVERKDKLTLGIKVVSENSDICKVALESMKFDEMEDRKNQVLELENLIETKTSIETKLDKLSVVRKSYDAANKANKNINFKLLDEASTLEDLLVKYERREKLKKAEASIKNLKDCLKILDKVTNFDLSLAIQLEELVDKKETLLISIAELDKEKAKAEKEAKQVKSEFEKFKKENGVCPACQGTGFVGGSDG